MKKLLLLVSIAGCIIGCKQTNEDQAQDNLTVIDTNYGKISADSFARLDASKQPKKDELQPGLTPDEVEKERLDEKEMDTSIDATMSTKPHIITHHSENDKRTDSIKVEAAKVRMKK